MPDFVLDHEPAGFARIKVIGVGGGGCNAVDSMFDLGLQNVEFYIINSDLQALKRSKCPNRMQIGSELTKGRGCGASPNLGERCMLDAKEEVIELLQGADIVFVTAGLGGGTGTGAAPVVAQIAKEMGILTVSVVTKPFKFEGPRRLKAAEAGLERLRDNCDTMIVINNERLLDHVGPKVPMKEAFKVADGVLAQAVSSISDLIATPGLINVDFNDIRTIMGGKGGAVMGVGTGKGENRAAEAVKKATSSPLLDKIVIDGATGVLICITGGPDMTLMEVSEATNAVQESADPEAEIIFGAVIDESLTDQIRVTIIATGFAEDVQRRQMQIGAASEAPQSTTATAPPAVPASFARPGFGTPANGGQRDAGVMHIAPTQAAPPAPTPAPQAEPVAELFEEMTDAPAPAPAPQAAAPAPAAAPQQPTSLRATLEAMMRDQGNGGQQNPIRVAKSTSEAPPVAQKNGGATGHPSVRPAGDVHASPSAEKAATKAEPAPQVSLFDPEQQQEEEKSEFETPAFLRRRRSLFE